jgi:hypothetical protein
LKGTVAWIFFVEASLLLAHFSQPFATKSNPSGESNLGVIQNFLTSPPMIQEVTFRTKPALGMSGIDSEGFQYFKAVWQTNGFKLQQVPVPMGIVQKVSTNNTSQMYYAWGSCDTNYWYFFGGTLQRWADEGSGPHGETPHPVVSGVQLGKLKLGTLMNLGIHNPDVGAIAISNLDFRAETSSFFPQKEIITGSFFLNNGLVSGANLKYGDYEYALEYEYLKELPVQIPSKMTLSHKGFAIVHEILELQLAADPQPNSAFEFEREAGEDQLDAHARVFAVANEVVYSNRMAMLVLPDGSLKPLSVWNPVPNSNPASKWWPVILLIAVFIAPVFFFMRRKVK